MSHDFPSFIEGISSATEESAKEFKRDVDSGAFASWGWSNGEMVDGVVALLKPTPLKSHVEAATEIIRRFVEWKNQDSEPDKIVDSLRELSDWAAGASVDFLDVFTQLGETLADKVKGMPCAAKAGLDTIRFLTKAFRYHGESRSDYSHLPFSAAALEEMHQLATWDKADAEMRKAFLFALNDFLRSETLKSQHSVWGTSVARLFNCLYAFLALHKPTEKGSEKTTELLWNLYKFLEQEETEEDGGEPSVYGAAWKALIEGFCVEHSSDEAGCKALEGWVGKSVEWAVMEVPEGHAGLAEVQAASLLFVSNVLLYTPKALEKDLETLIQFYIQHLGEAALAGGITSAYTKNVGQDTIEKHTREFVAALPELEPEPQISFFNILELISRTKPLLFEREVERLEPYLSDDAVCNQTVLILKRLAEVNNRVFESRGGDYVFRLSRNIPNPKTKMDLVSIYALIFRLSESEAERAVNVMDKSIREETESSHKALYLHFWKDMVQENSAPFVPRRPFLLELRKDAELTSRCEEILKHLPAEGAKEPPPSPDPPEKQPRPATAVLYNQPKQQTPRAAEAAKPQAPPKEPERELSKSEELAKAKACTLFFSYHPKHRKEVKMLVRLLELHDLKCWMHPGGIEKGDYLKEGVDAALKSCESVLLCVDKRYTKTDVCTDELRRAMVMDKGNGGTKTNIPLQFESMEWPPRGPQKEILHKFNTVPFYLSTNEKPYRSHPWPKRGEDALFMILKHLGLWTPRPDPPDIGDDSDDDEPRTYNYESSDGDDDASKLKESVSLPPISPERRSISASSRGSRSSARSLREEDAASLNSSVNGGSQRPDRVVHSAKRERQTFGQGPSAGGGRASRPSYFNPNIGSTMMEEDRKLPSVYRQRFA